MFGDASDSYISFDEYKEFLGVNYRASVHYSHASFYFRSHFQYTDNVTDTFIYMYFLFPGPL